jgi:hypothetical protein
MGDHSSRPAFACGLKRPTRATSSNDAPEPRRFFAAPIRSCSRWGLPCRPCCQARGALLPHPFTVASPKRSPSALCGTVPDPSCEKPPGVTRHRRYAEPGLSSRILRCPRSPDPLASGVLASCSAPVERVEKWRCPWAAATRSTCTAPAPSTFHVALPAMVVSSRSAFGCNEQQSRRLRRVRTVRL